VNKGERMDTHLEIKGDENSLYVTANGADMVIGSNHPLYIELRLVVDNVIKSATRNTRKSVAGSLTLDDLIYAARERLNQLEECKRQQADE
jgi:hypothetical protein